MTNTPEASALPHRTPRRGRMGLSIAIVAILAAAGTHWAATHTVLRMPQGTAVLPKRFVSLKEVVVDARTWTYDDYTARPELTAAMRRAGYGDILDALRRKQMKSDFDDLKRRGADQLEAWKAEAAKAFEAWWKETMDYWRPATNAAPATE